jgi:hippurate hydrolase
MTATSPRRPAKTGAPEPEARFAGLVDEARSLQPRTVALRRAVHRHPEQGLNLPNTQASVLRALDGLPLRVRTGGELSSVVAVLRGDAPGPAVLLRGDMDALPLDEGTGLPFASETAGTMHACGHDMHVAMLAAAARLLCARRDALVGQVVFMFQPGEEGYAGARQMIDEGVLDVAGPRVSRAYALHVTATTRSGAVATRSGPIMASSDEFAVLVRGRGGHGAMPHEALDPVPAAAAMVGALQTMVTRRVSVAEPAVVTVGRIAAGTTTNIIPETAELIGTVRALTDGSRALVLTELRRVCEHVAAAYGCTADVTVRPGYPVTVNDAGASGRMIELATAVLGPRHTEPMPDPIMGSEDFSYVLERVPGALAFLGACPPGVRPENAAPNHSGQVLFDESAMACGAALYAALALDTLR